MPKRRLLLFGVLAILVLGVGACLLRPPTAITPENAAKIEKGMTLTDIETILGGPSRDESAGTVVADLGEFDDDLRLFGNPHHAWQSDRVLILVWMGADGRVENRTAMVLLRDSPLETLRSWFRF